MIKEIVEIIIGFSGGTILMLPCERWVRNREYKKSILYILGVVIPVMMIIGIFGGVF